MKLPRISLILCFILGGLVNQSVHAEAPKAMHWAADRSVVNRKTNVVNLRGNAFLSRDNEELRADEIDLYLNTDYVEARGRITYQYGQYLIRADAMEINTRSKTGVVHNGNLTNGHIALRGQEMNLVAQDHMIVKNYEYTTCLDCPNAWAMAGREADLTFEGYAFIKDFIFKIKDASVAWMPYMILPLKSKRQSGFIMPRFGLNEIHGYYVVQPYFWAINDSADMTLGAGTYTRRGLRMEWEGRYALTDRSQGTFNLYLTKDKKLEPDISTRIAGKALVTQELPWGFEAKLRYLDVSDSGYPIEFTEDIVGRYEPVLTSELFFSRNDPNLSTTLSFKRIRNLLYFDPNQSNQYKSGFDPSTVQELPKLVINSNDQFLFGSKLAAGIEARYNRFIRSSGAIDNTSGVVNPSPSDETIRNANRVTLIPSLYTALNPLPWLSLIPSAQYRSYFYNFNGTTGYPDLERGYLLTQAEASFQIEKVYPASDDFHASYKHAIRPRVVYSWIPTIQQPLNHPFIERVQGKAATGQYFDNSDIVPLGATQNLESYFTPLGNSLTYGFTTQIYRKKPLKHVDSFSDQVRALEEARSAVVNGNSTAVSRLAEFSILQTWDIREAKRSGTDGIYFSPLFTRLLFENEGFSWSTDYTYFVFLDRYTNAKLIPYPSPHRLSTGLSWTLDKQTKNGTLFFERSFAINYTFSKLNSKVSSLSATTRFSINDYLMPSVSLSYDLLSPDQKLLESKFGLLYQSPSQCWRIEGALTRAIDRATGISLAFSLNLMGSVNGVDDQLRN